MTGRNTPRAAALLLIAAFTSCKDATQPGGEFTISPPSHTMSVGATVQLSAINPPGAVTWSSNLESVATVVPETGFVTGVGSGTATISAVSGSAVATSEITVQIPPTIVLDPALVILETLDGAGAPEPATVQITNGGDVELGTIDVGAVQYGQGEPTGWLNLTLNSPTVPATLTLNASVAGLTAGTYTASVPITAAAANNSPQQIAVQLRILTPASIEVSRTSVSLPALPGEVVSDVVDVTNGGTAPLGGLAADITYQGQASGWLQANLSSTTPPAQLTLQATVGALAVGTYNATVTLYSALDAAIEQRDIDVALIVSPGPAIRLSETGVVFNSGAGNPPIAAQTVQVTNSGGGQLTGLAVGDPVYTSGTPGWLTASIDATDAPATITLTVTSPPTGTNTATVQVTSPVASNSPATLTVTLTDAAIALNPTAVTFGSFQGAPAQYDPGAQYVNITNVGTGQLTNLTASVSYGPGGSGWLDVQITPSTAPAQLLIEATTGGLAYGTYSATVEVSAPGSGAAPKTVNVTFNVSSFVVDVMPILNARCTGACHTHLTGAETSLQVYNWASSSSRVVMGFPDAPGSTLYCRMTTSCGSQMPPQPEPAVPDDDIMVIYNWILRGAPYQ